MLTRARASFSTARARAPGLLRRRLVNAGSSLKRIRAFRSVRRAATGLLTIMRIFPRPAASAADSERMLTRAAASARLMPARTPGFDWSVRTSWVVLGIVRLLQCFSELHASRSWPGASASARVGGEYALHAGWVVHRQHPGDEPARGAAHGHERDPRSRHDPAVGACHDAGLLVAWIVAPRLHRRARAAHRDDRAERSGPVERHAKLRRHARFAGGERAEPECGLVEQGRQGRGGERAVGPPERRPRLPRSADRVLVESEPGAQPQVVVGSAREARPRDR